MTQLTICRRMFLLASITLFCGCVTHHSLISSGVTSNELVARSWKNRDGSMGASAGYDPQKLDPLESDPRYRRAFEEAEAKAERKLARVPRTLGFVHLYWQTKKEILRRDYGIDWKTPAELNPNTSYD